MSDAEKSREQLLEELEQLRKQVIELKQVEKEHKHVVENMKSAKAELEQHTREIALLSEMGELLQSCLNTEEAYTVIDHTAQQLFPEASGALCVFDSSRDLVEMVVAWGDDSLGERLFSSGDCWALRRGQLFSVGDASSGLICKHVGEPQPFSYVCVPMMAQGETLGILHLRGRAWGENESEPGPVSLVESKLQLAMTVAEHFALALANLKLRESLRSQAIRDPLTGLFNRRYMEESLARELRRAERKGVTVGVIMVDIDHFKNFNDTFGHAVGDYLLRELGVFLNSLIRGEDIASRYGGEEFVIILPEASLEETRQRAEHIREDVKRLNLHDHFQFEGNMTVSVGVAIAPEHGASSETILKAVDQALYKAKNEGRDRVALADPPKQ
jgi:diguanylate cyclase (GGDEF)-like protein